MGHDLGKGWCDRAKAIAKLPAPPCAKAKPKIAPSKRHAGRQVTESPLQTQLETEYELRHRLGNQRMQNRTRFQAAAKAHAINIDADCQLSEVSLDQVLESEV